ncbi:uncharacterized protein [Argopecten irradians]|uniref:uncharacterized protein n=1 Tax=Argopecten irradians TaxID=31199 RepID=UPI0037230B54
MGGTFCKLFRKRQMKVILNGLDAAGKTTILYKLKLGQVVTTIPTIGFNVETVDHSIVQMVTWDVGGRGKMRALYRYYYQGSDALFFVVDSNDRDRIDEAKEELFRTMEEYTLKDVIVVILANKQDKVGAFTSEEVGDKLDLDVIRKSHMCEVFGTSATTGEGLNEMLDWVVEVVSTKRAAKVLESKSECVPKGKEERGSKSFYFSSTVSFIKHVFSKV